MEAKTGDKINVLYVVIQTNLGGSERVVLDLATHIDRSRFRVYVAYFIRGTLDKAFDEICEETFHIVKGKGVDLGAALRLSRVIREKQIHVVNAHHYMCFFYSYLACKVLNGRGLVYAEHSVPEVEGISGMHKLICNAFMRRTDAVVGVSREITNAFRDKFPSHSDRIVSIPNGVNVGRFASNASREGRKAGLGLGPDHFVIGIVANFRHVKNHACLLRAFHRLSDIYPHVRLVMVGKGFPQDPENSEEEVRRLIRDFRLDGRVILTGYCEDIRDIMQSLDVFCLPSLSEGLPVSVLEAMAAKAVVVGSDVRGNREVISHGKTGLLFASNDDGALSQALELLIKDNELRGRLTENAFTFVSQAHGFDQWISGYEGLFESVSFNSRPRGPDLC